jgi:hypothetical protein
MVATDGPTINHNAHKKLITLSTVEVKPCPNEAPGKTRVKKSGPIKKSADTQMGITKNVCLVHAVFIDSHGDAAFVLRICLSQR